MKKMKFSSWIFLFVSLCFLASCQPEHNEEDIQTVSFEDVVLEGGKLSKTSFSSGGLIFDGMVSEYDTWFGVAASSQTDQTTGDYTNDFSVYGTSGASGSKFAVFYYDSYNIVDAGTTPFCRFEDTAPHVVKSLKVNNSTYVYLTIKNGNGFSQAFAAGDYFKLTIIGYNGENQVGAVDFYLADFREGKSYICDSWTSVNLEKLGAITKFTFEFDSSDKGYYGINTPTYVCIDDIKYVK